MRSALEWAQVRALAADGVSQREIARRLGINRRTVRGLVEADEPPRYERAPAGSMLDPLEPVLRRLLEEWPQIKAPRVTEVLRDDYGYAGSVDLVRKRLAALRPRDGAAGAADGLSAGAGAAARLGRDADAAEDRRARAAGLRADRALPFSGAQTAHFSFDMTIESFLEGHVRAFEWLGGVPRECVYDNLRSAVARRERRRRVAGIRGSCSCAATTPSTRRPARRRRRARRARSRARSATSRPASGRRGASRSLAELDEHYADWRDRVALPRRHATGRFLVAERLADEREALRPLPPIAFDAAGRRSSRVPLDGYLKHGGSFYRAPEALVHQRVELRFDRDQVWIEHRGADGRALPAQLRRRDLAAAAADAPRAADASRR